MKNISIIIPAHNEEKRIGATLEAYGSFFTDLKRNALLDPKIMVVINNTADRTEEIVKNFVKKYPILEYMNIKPGGKGLAISEGFRNALNKQYELIGFVDADMATSPQAFNDLVQNIGNYDGIIGSRYVSGAIVEPKQTFRRIVASRLFNFLVRAFFLMPYKDTQCGAKIFKQEVIRKINPELRLTQWAFDVNLLYLCKKFNYRIKEHATIWRDKEYSTLNLGKAGPQMFFSIIRLRIINSFLERLLRPFRFISHLGDRIINRK